MSKRKKSKSKSTKTIIIIALIMVIILIVAVITPFIGAWVNDQLNNAAFDAYVGTYNNQTTDLPADVPAGNPNYVQNTSSDRQYSIDSQSYIDTKGAGNTKFGENYIDSTNYLKIVVTDDNDTAIPNQVLELTITQKSTEYYATFGGFLAGICAGAIIGGYASSWSGPGIVVGIIAGAIIGGVGGYLYDSGHGSENTILSNSTITCNQGDNQNEYIVPANIDWFGGYGSGLVSIQLSPSVLIHYSPFATTNSIYGVIAGQVIYVRLVNGDSKLLAIQSQLKADNEYQGYRQVDSVKSLGHFEGSYAGYPNHDSFRGLDSANNTNLAPQISIHDNQYVYKVKETRMFTTKSLTGIDLMEYPPGTFSIYFGILNFDSNNTLISAEDSNAVEGFLTTLNNVSVPIQTGVNIPLASGAYYYASFSYTLSTPSPEFKSLLYVTYKISGTSYCELLGEQDIKFTNQPWVTSFSYAYNDYWSDDQTIHRTIYDCNDKIQLCCDYNSPYFLNSSQSTFIFRFFVAINGTDTIYPTGQYLFGCYVDIENNGTLVTYAFANCYVGFNGIGSCQLIVNIPNSVQDITSYKLVIACYSLEPTIFGAGYTVNPYMTGLYFLLDNYRNFRSDVHDLQGLIDSLTDKTLVGQGTYDLTNSILGTIKTKIHDLEASLDNLNSLYPTSSRNEYQAVRDSITKFKFYFKEVSGDMGKWTPGSMNGNDYAFSKFLGDLQGLQFQYSDSFVNYNVYVAGLKGESQIVNEVTNETKAYRDWWTQKYIEDKNNELSNFLPPYLLVLALVISLCLTAMTYYALKNKFGKKKTILFILCIVVFGVSAYILYLFLGSMSYLLLGWYYGV